jgi:hypothetical protein
LVQRQVSRSVRLVELGVGLLRSRYIDVVAVGERRAYTSAYMRCDAPKRNQKELGWKNRVGKTQRRKTLGGRKRTRGRNRRRSASRSGERTGLGRLSGSTRGRLAFGSGKARSGLSRLRGLIRVGLRQTGLGREKQVEVGKSTRVRSPSSRSGCGCLEGYFC